MNIEMLLEANRLCTVTHPNQPNYSGHSRGRKCHITDDGKKSLCNMLVDKVFEPKKGTSWTSINNGLCFICQSKKGNVA